MLPEGPWQATVEKDKVQRLLLLLIRLHYLLGDIWIAP